MVPDAAALTARILRDAEEEGARRLAEARAEVAAAAAAAAEDRTRETANVLAAARRTLEAEARAATARERREGAGRLARAREAAVARVLDATAAALEIPCADDERRRMAGALAREVAAALPHGALVARAHPTWQAAVAHAFPAAVVTSDPSLGAGVELASADGRVRIDATLAGRVGRQRAALALDAARMLDAAVADA